MSEVYLGNPNLKKANTPIEFTKENIQELIRHYVAGTADKEK